MTAKKMTTTTAVLILAAFALVGVMTTVLASQAYAQDGDQDFARDADKETGDVQIAEAKPDVSDHNRQGNLISLLEKLQSTSAMGAGIGAGTGAGLGSGLGPGSGIDSNSSQGQTVDHPAQDNAATFGDDLGISNAFNVGSVNVDLHDLVDVRP